MNSAAPRRVIVVGLGVMGGSVARSLKRRAPRVEVIGIDPDEARAALASRDGFGREARLADCEPEGAVVVFAAPLDTTVDLVRATAGVWSRAALATDVASLKVPVMEAARPDAPRAGHGSPAPPARTVFVGAHPMCGSERSGYAAARDDLFEGAEVWLCPPPCGEAPLAAAEAFWRLLGARPRTIAAEEHDRLMAWASHLPQLVASALAGTLDDAGILPGALGPGGRDMTRLAGSSASMWLPLLEAARERDARALAALEERIASVRRMLEEGDRAGLARLMERGRGWKSRAD